VRPGGGPRWVRQLEDGARPILGRDLTREESASLQRYVELITAWQQVHRLVGSTDPEWIVRELLLDSLLFLRVVPETAVDVLDLGSGAGIPGVPMRIVQPELRLTMVEARARRASFLRAVVRELALSRTTVLDVRAEAAAGGGVFDAVVMRCAGRADSMIGLGMAFLRQGGTFVAASKEGAHAPAGSHLVRVAVTGGRVRWFITGTRSGE
jgi:16S rRNA (guanine527-N7)-methyltransferase